MKAHSQVYSVQFFPDPAPPGTSEQLFTVEGVNLGDYVAANKPTPQSGLIIDGARASANDQIALTFVNDSGGPIQPIQGEFYTILVVSPHHHCEEDKPKKHRRPCDEE